MKPYDIHQTRRSEKLLRFFILATGVLTVILAMLNIDKSIIYTVFVFLAIAVFYQIFFVGTAESERKNGERKIRIPLPFALKIKPFSFLTATLLVTWVIGGLIFVGSLFQIAKISPIAGSVLGAILGLFLFMFVPQH